MRDDSARRVRWFPYAVIAVLLAFLAAGTVSNLDRNPQPQLVAEGIPGRSLPATDVPYDLVRHALADLDALTLKDGATLAGWNGPWRFVWPRDASFVAAARCSVGQYAEADKVLGFLNRIKPTEGRWGARYSAPEGIELQDGRDPQLDGSGWILWATWFCSNPEAARAAPRPPESTSRSTGRWSGNRVIRSSPSLVRRSACGLAGLLGEA